MSIYSTAATSAAWPVVDESELIDWLGIESIDFTVFQMVGTIATQRLIDYLQLELVARTRVVTYNSLPVIGTAISNALSKQDAAFNCILELPYANLISIDSVLLDGDVVPSTQYSIVRGTTDFIAFNFLPVITSELSITYTAGYGASASNVPEQLRQAATITAAYLYEHRGACMGGDVIRDSGAATLAASFRSKVVSL